jgi:hypothetical protein
MNNAAPAIVSAPETYQLVRYEAARQAIAECERLDECKDWSDKAAAIAAYARQKNDHSLRVMAIRIQARAERRLGELLKQIPPDESTRYGRASPRPPGGTRKQAAFDAGLSDYERKRALRTASVPEADFNRQVEGPQPPTVRELADQGTQSRAVETTPESERFKAACAALHAFVGFCDANDAADTAEVFRTNDIEMARACATTLDQWLDRFVSNLPLSDA